MTRPETFIFGQSPDTEAVPTENANDPTAKTHKFLSISPINHSMILILYLNISMLCACLLERLVVVDIFSTLITLQREMMIYCPGCLVRREFFVPSEVVDQFSSGFQDSLHLAGVLVCLQLLLWKV